MDIWVEGSIYDVQNVGGISRIFDEILPLIGKKWNLGKIKILSLPRQNRSCPVQENLEFVSAGFFLKWIHLSQSSILSKVLRFLVWQYWFIYCSFKPAAIWFSSYYKKPYRWKGKQVFLVADLIHDRFSNLFSGNDNARFRRQRKNYLRQADAIISISYATAEDLKKYYDINPERIHVVYLAQSKDFKQISKPQEVYRSPSTKPFILYVGGRVHYKNFQFLAEAFSLWNKKKNMDLILVGGGNFSDEEVQFFKKIGIYENTHFLSGLDDQKLCALYNQAAAFVYPSLWEGFGIPVLEAMACGCPVVASDIPTNRELAQDIAFFFDPLDQKQFLQRLDEAVSLHRQGPQVEAGLRRVQDFSWKKTADQIMDVCQSVFVSEERPFNEK